MSAPRRLGRSIVGRVALGAVLVALLAVSVLFAVTYTTVATATTHALRTAVDTDLAGLADIAAGSGRDELVARIANRIALQARDGRQPHYLLTDGAGRRLAGDIAARPALSADRSEEGYVAPPGMPPLYARATRLAPDLVLVVASEYGPERALLQRLALAFASAGLGVVVAVGLLAWASAGRLSARVDRINATFRDADVAAIAALADARGADELAELARHSAAALARLQALVASYRQVSDHVAHEIRTPLAHLDRRLLDLRRAPGDTAAIDHARAEIADLVRLLESLLDIAASEARRGDPSGKITLDIAEIARDLADLYGGSLEDAGLRFETAIAPTVAMQGEPMQLRRMLSNLLDNAIKYVPAGGTVRLSVAAGPVIVVEDDGPGVASARRATIFDRFVRDAGGGPPGHGLGLTLARAIAARHGLAMTLDDTARGCRFRVAPESAA